MQRAAWLGSADEESGEDRDSGSPAVSARACRAGRGLSQARTAPREKVLVVGLVEVVAEAISSRWSSRSGHTRSIDSHYRWCRASHIDTAQSTISNRGSAIGTHYLGDEGPGARLSTRKYSGASVALQTSPRLPQMRAQSQTVGRWTTRACRDYSYYRETTDRVDGRHGREDAAVS